MKASLLIPSRKYVMRQRVLYEYPGFFHEFLDRKQDFDSWNPLCHNYRGSFLRHKTVEQLLLFLREDLLCNTVGDACPLFDAFDSFLDIAFGINCNFPSRDIALYFVWRLRGERGVRIAQGEEALRREREK